MPPQGEIFYPGALSIMSADIVRGHGISPQPMTLTLVPQKTPVHTEGDLVLRYNGRTVRFRKCRGDQVQYRYSQEGYLWQIVLLDRRWEWRYARYNSSTGEAITVNGRYNVRLPHGPVEIMDPRTKKSAKELMIMCLKAMGETNYRLGVIPERYPEIVWDNTKPAEGLQQICDDCGMRVILDLNDRVLILTPGWGIEDLPGGAVIYDNFGVNPPEKPDYIQLVCGGTRYQGDFYAEAVGDDVDGIVVPINELTYKPPGGWENGDLLHFTDVPRIQAGTARSDWRSFASPRDLAKASVYRKYRVSLKSFQIPGYKDKSKLKDIQRVLPLGQQLVEPTFDPKTGWFRPLETIVWGCYFYDHTNNIEMPQAVGADGKSLPPWKFKPQIVIPSKNPITGAEERTKETTVVPNEDYDFDGETGIITFRNIMWRYGEDDTGAKRTHLPALIWIRCGVVVNTPERVPERHVERIVLVSDDKTIKHSPKLVHQVFDETLFVRHTPTYSPGRPDSITGAKNNKDIVAKEARIRLRGEAAKFQTLEPKLRKYVGWDNFQMDGSVHQVCYHLEQDGKATMTVCLNDELTILTMPYAERRYYEKVRSQDRELETLMKFIRQENVPFSQISNFSSKGR